MPNDLLIAVAVMTTMSTMAGMFTGLIAYSTKGQRTMLGLALATLAMVYFLFYGSGQLFWAKYVTDSAAIVYTNFAAIFAAMASGWAWRLPNTPTWRRCLLAMLLAMGSVVAIFWPLLSIAVRPPPTGGDDWQIDVAMQTSWATCSPAAAATLLRTEGIEVSESEMIPLCLTDASGTPTLGLYRGIKIVADRNDRRVSVVDESLDELIAKDDWPVLLAVKLPFGTEDPRYANQWGWIPGMGHSVVAFGTTDDGTGLFIGDPSVGLEAWTLTDMKVLWHGDGIRVH